MIEISLGQRLHELRDKADLSLRELARKVGISGPFLSDFSPWWNLPSASRIVSIVSSKSRVDRARRSSFQTTMMSPAELMPRSKYRFAELVSRPWQAPRRSDRKRRTFPCQRPIDLQHRENVRSELDFFRAGPSDRLPCKVLPKQVVANRALRTR